MSQERLNMKKLRDVLRLHFECQLSNRSIARALSLSATTVGQYVKAAKISEQPWEVLCTFSDRALMLCLENHSERLKKQRHKQAIDFARVHLELKRKGVTRELLHAEYTRSSSSKTISYMPIRKVYVPVWDWRERMPLVL